MLSTTREDSNAYEQGLKSKLSFNVFASLADAAVTRNGRIQEMPSFICCRTEFSSRSMGGGSEIGGAS